MDKTNITNEKILIYLALLGALVFVTGVEIAESAISIELMAQLGDNVWYYIVACVFEIASFLLVFFLIKIGKYRGRMLSDILDTSLYCALVSVLGLGLHYAHHHGVPGLDDYNVYLGVVLRLAWLVKIGVIIGQGQTGLPVIGPFGLHETRKFGNERQVSGWKWLGIALFLALAALLIWTFHGQVLPLLIFGAIPLLGGLFAVFPACFVAAAKLSRESRARAQLLADYAATLARHEIDIAKLTAGHELLLEEQAQLRASIQEGLKLLKGKRLVSASIVIRDLVAAENDDYLAQAGRPNA